jgi:two-component system nitrogen regulation response regulator NtrX
MRRILLVEDDPDVRPLLEHVLRGDGCAVDVAATAASARAFLRANVYDLVLADGRLPDGDGIEIADEAKELGTKTVVLTGYALSFPADRLARHEYHMKPIAPRELLGIVDRSIGPGVDAGAIL